MMILNFIKTLCNLNNHKLSGKAQSFWYTVQKKHTGPRHNYKLLMMALFDQISSRVV